MERKVSLEEFGIGLTVQVTGLPLDCDEQAIRQLCSGFGKISSVWHFLDRTGQNKIAEVCYTTVDDAESAAATVDNIIYLGLRLSACCIARPTLPSTPSIPSINGEPRARVGALKLDCMPGREKSLKVAPYNQRPSAPALPTFMMLRNGMSETPPPLNGPPSNGPSSIADTVTERPRTFSGGTVSRSNSSTSMCDNNNTRTSGFGGGLNISLQSLSAAAATRPSPTGGNNANTINTSNNQTLPHPPPVKKSFLDRLLGQ